MLHIHLIHWLLDFMGIHNGEDVFSTRMYNFWSGFGGNISVLALIGTLAALYRHHYKTFRQAINPINIVKAPYTLTHKDKKDKE